MLLPLSIVLLLTQIDAVDHNDDHPWQRSDKTGWIDPSDPNSRNFKNADDRAAAVKLFEENQRLQSRIAELEASRGALVPVTPATPTCDRQTSIDEVEITIFKHFLRKLEAKFSSPGSYVAEIRISQQVLLSWREFLTSSSSSPIESKVVQKIAGSVSDLFSRLTKESDALSKAGYFDAIFDFIRSYLPLLNFCILVPAAALLLVRILRVSRWQLALWIFFLIFFISVVWTWIHLYKERQAEIQARFVRHAARRGGAPEFCKPQGNSVSAWKALKDYVGSWFSFKPDDPCVEYFKDVMIDPMWTVSPLEAVSVAVAKFFVRPLEPLAHGLSQFWRALLKDLPLAAYCVILPAMGVCMAFLLLVMFGYRLRLGYGLLSLEPYGHRFQQLQNAVAPKRQAREISTQTVPAVTWTAANLTGTMNSDRFRNGQGKAHVRRGSVSS